MLHAYCPAERKWFRSRLIGGSMARVQLTNVRESCPTCGAMSALPDGVYETVSAVRAMARDMTRDELLATFQEARAALALDDLDQRAAAAERIPLVMAIRDASRPKDVKDVLLYLALIWFVIAKLLGHNVALPDELGGWVPGDGHGASEPSTDPSAPPAPSP